MYVATKLDHYVCSMQYTAVFVNNNNNNNINSPSYQNRVAGWVNGPGAPLLHGQGHKWRSLSGERGFVQGLVCDEMKYRRSETTYLMCLCNKRAWKSKVLFLFCSLSNPMVTIT